MGIEELSTLNHYSSEKWLERGLNPSSTAVVLLLENSTSVFFEKLVKLRNQDNLNQSQLSDSIIKLTDGLPWNELDTEEKEMLADTLAPAIKSLGLNPWLYF